MAGYILAIDQGTSSSRAILFDENQNIVTVSQREFTQIYPHSGWIEHDAMEIYESVLDVVNEAVVHSRIAVRDIKAVGIANQRETTNGRLEPPHGVTHCKRNRVAVQKNRRNLR